MRFSLLAAAALLALPVSARAQGGTLTDPVIVGIFDAANTWDIGTGGLARTKAGHKDVKAFARMLVDAHTAVRKQGRALAGKLGVTPVPVARDFALAVDYTDTMKKLEGLSGTAFDRAFLEHEIAYHQAVIDAVTKQFLPAIKNAELKTFVESVAPAFVAHLQGAKELLAKL